MPVRVQDKPPTIMSRAIDNNGNVQNPPAQVTVTVLDATPPTSTIFSPGAGEILLTARLVTISGGANDFGGAKLARVEVSVDGGSTYSAATGTIAWKYAWTPTSPGQVTIKSRAIDNSGNLQVTPDEVTVTVRTPLTIKVPADQPTIQSAIDVAEYGDTVLAAPGTYHENIDFGKKRITVTSESGPEFTFIDGGNVAPVVSFTAKEGRDSALNGFTLQNGRRVQGSLEGGGIWILGSSPTITNNVIRNNHACQGGGIGISGGRPLIQLNTITMNGSDNCTGGGGNGISIGGASFPEILDNVISENVSSFGSDGGGILIIGSEPIIKNNIIKGNNTAGGQGGGIWLGSFSNAQIVQNRITGNQANVGGGIYWLIPNDARGPIVVNNTITDNDATSLGSGIFAEGADGQTKLTNNIIVAKPGQFGLYCGDLNNQDQPIVRFNNIFSAGGMAYGGICSDKTGTDGNISADPLFTNPAQDDYHLRQESPSIDSGDNLTSNLPNKDLDGFPRNVDGNGEGTAIVDMGVYEFRRPIRVPAEQPTIQSAIDVATDGDRVLVAPGTYTENINFRGKAITVTSESGPEVTTIDGGNIDSVVLVTSGEGRKSILSGFTLQNGSANPNRSLEGGGISIQNSSPTITNNVIRNNKACFGGGIGMGASSPLIQGNTITANSNISNCSFGDGGGISVRGEASSIHIEILDNEISGNGLLPNTSAGGGIYMNGGKTAIIKGNIIKGNNASDQGGGIYIINASDALIVQNLITGNRAFFGGGISWLTGGPTLVNNTIADNDGTNGSGIYAEGNDGRSELTNNIIVAKPGQPGLYCNNFDDQTGVAIHSNNIYSNGGMAYGGTCSDRTGTDGNISADPLFTNPTQGDYHLQPGSPSIDSGDSLTPYLSENDLDGQPRILDGDGIGTAAVDLGVYEFLAPSTESQSTKKATIWIKSKK
jgi:nitrous oxidase accessory protein NosD